MLYTGDSIEGCFIEKLQRYRGSDDAAFTILDGIDHLDGDTSVIPVKNRIPAELLNNLAVSNLRVADSTREVAQIDALETLMALREFGKANLGIDLPDLKPADVLHTSYLNSQAISVIAHATRKVVGTAGRSSLDSLSDVAIHTNYNLYRDVPYHGSAVYVQLDRVWTYRALDRYSAELRAAIDYLKADSELTF